jgi:hypothetical protein
MHQGLGVERNARAFEGKDINIRTVALVAQRSALAIEQAAEASTEEFGGLVCDTWDLKLMAHAAVKPLHHQRII